MPSYSDAQVEFTFVYRAEGFASLLYFCLFFRLGIFLGKNVFFLSLNFNFHASTVASDCKLQVILGEKLLGEKKRVQS